VNDDCVGRDAAEDYPVKAPKAAKPHRTGVCWWIERDGEVFLETRDAKQMLGGMRALPSDGWDVKRHPGSRRVAVSGSMPRSPEMVGGEAWMLKRVQHDGGDILGTITHVFTHFSLTLEIRRILLKPGCSLELEGEWWPKAKLGEAGLPSLFVKAAHLALGSE
jgi:A/G-specific adenine glycosylase